MATTITTRLQEEDKQIIEDFCEKYDISISWLIRKAIKDYILKVEAGEEEIFS